MTENQPYDEDDSGSPSKDDASLIPPVDVGAYPVPLTPYPPEIAHKIEKERAFRAEATRNLGCFLQSKDVLFCDSWMVVINKPKGVYSEHVLDLMPELMSTIKNEEQYKTLFRKESNSEILSGSTVEQFSNLVMGETNAESESKISIENHLNVGKTFEEADDHLRLECSIQKSKRGDHYDTTIMKNIESNKTSCPLSEDKYYLINRLDRDTSGAIFIARNSKAAAKMGKTFAKHMVEKTYLGICFGKFPNWKEKTLLTGHGRSKYGMWRVYDEPDIGRKLPGNNSVKNMNTKIVIVGNVTKPIDLIPEPNLNSEFVEEPEVRLTLGLVQTDSVSKIDPNDDTVDLMRSSVGRVPSLEPADLVCGTEPEVNVGIAIRAYPVTGRTHQIRLHCQYLGLPLLGDVRYGGPMEFMGAPCGTHALHAEKVEFVHPMTQESISIKAPLPDWAKDWFGNESE